MFTKEDYREYFSSIREKEAAMVDFMKKAVSSVDDKDIAKVLRDILEDETYHVGLADELLNYL